MGRWWDRSDRIEWELRTLRERGFRVLAPTGIPESGPLKVEVWTFIEGREHKLEVVFPDLYPYFQFEVLAPDLDLGLHQHRLQKNLCLLGRDDVFRSRSDSVAAFLQERLPRLLLASSVESKEEAEALEDQQAEPVTAYYPYTRPGAILMDSSWRVRSDQLAGLVHLGAVSKVKPYLRLAVLRLLDLEGNVIHQARDEWIEKYAMVMMGRWLQRETHYLEADAESYFNASSSELPGNLTTRLSLKDQKVLLVVAPEEHAWREAQVGGWVGVGECRLGKSSRKEYYFLQVAYAGDVDLQERIPELEPLRARRVAVVGLGSLGAPLAIGLAQAGVKELQLIDSDWVDPATSVRWPLGFAEAGELKHQALHRFIVNNHPYTSVKVLTDEDRKFLAQSTGVNIPEDWHPEFQRIGQASNLLDLDFLVKFFEHADLLVDATGDHGCQNFIFALAKSLGIPFLSVHGTQGGWGGVVFRWTPGSSSGCWFCAETLMRDGVIPAPPGVPQRIQPRGCGDRTFTGAGFDMHSIALAAVRGVSELLSEGYATAPWDLLTISYRAADGQAIVPEFKGFSVTVHEKCPFCGEDQELG